jgi:parallel beta-helix repeat protein
VIDGADYALQGNESGIGVDLSNHNSVAVKNLQISHFDNGIYLLGSSNNTVSGNQFTNNTNGITLLYSADNNTISGNIITNNTNSTSLLAFPANYAGSAIFMNQVLGNVISGNTITNSIYGIMTYEVSYNRIIGNKIANNSYGIYSTFNAKHVVYGNNFINNNAQVVYSSPSISTWDNGTAGNYWSDYITRYPNAKEIDSSGIGDTPYVIDANNQDHFPLMKTVVIPPVTPPQQPAGFLGSSLPVDYGYAIVVVAVIAVAAITGYIYLRRIR